MPPHPPAPSHAKRVRVAHAHGVGTLAREVAALSVLDIQAGAGGTHTSLPLDLYLLTVYCDEGLNCHTAGDASRLRVLVSALRTAPATFSTLGAGQLAIALLTPQGLLQTFAMPLDGLTDRRLPLRDIVSGAAEADLHAQLVDAEPGPARCSALGHWLESRLRERRPLEPAARRAAAAAMQLLDGDEAGGSGALARRHGSSRRQLERDFRRWLGVSPSAYARLARFQRAAAALGSGGAPADVAAAAGFSDQAHMTRVFRDTAGLTPGRLRSAARGAEPLPRAAQAGRLLMLPAEAALRRS